MKKAISLILTLLIICSSGTMIINAYAEESKKDVVYTGRSDTSFCDGSYDYPYTNLSDAINACSEGGTIYIKSGSYTFVNDVGNDAPFVISKSVTITTEPDYTSKGYISVRAAGILLTADISFINVDFGFANPFHNAIMVSGYKADFNNTGKASGCFSVHVFAGGMSGYQCDDNATINISGKETVLGNIYAGGLNCGFNGDVNIIVNGSNGMKIGDIYCSGASEAYVDRDNWFDITDPEAPSANPSTYTVSRRVDISLIRISGKYINGAGASETYVYCYADDNAMMSNISLNNIDNLVVINGEVEPLRIKNNSDKPINISIRKDAVLNLTKIASLTCNNFNGQGSIILDTFGLLTINGSIDGTTTLKTKGCSNSASGAYAVNHTYIIGNFLYNRFNICPNTSQSEYYIYLDDNELKIVNPNEGSHLNLSAINFKYDTVVMRGGICTLPVELTGVDDNCNASDFDITYVVKHDNNEYISITDDDYLGVAAINELNAEFYIYSEDSPVNGVLNANVEISLYNEASDTETYEITAYYNNGTGTISDSFKIIVSDTDASYNISYKWNDDNSGCIAYAKCDNSTLSIEENALINETIISSPSCSEEGSKLIIATFKNDIFTSQTSEITIPKKSHTDLNGDSICDFCGKTNNPIISISPDKTKCVKGETVTWVIETDSTVNWIKLSGKYTANDTGTNTFSYYCKFGNQTNSKIQTTENNGIRTWIIPIMITYSSADDKVIENFSISYKSIGSSIWKDAELSRGKYSTDIVIGRNAEALELTSSNTYSAYTLIDAVSDKSQASKGEIITLTINVTNDITKIRVGLYDSSLGKNRTVTYQVSSSNVKSITRNNDGTSTWIISYKVPSYASDNTDLIIQARGNAWGEAKTISIDIE